MKTSSDSTLSDDDDDSIMRALSLLVFGGTSDEDALPHVDRLGQPALCTALNEAANGHPMDLLPVLHQCVPGMHRKPLVAAMAAAAEIPTAAAAALAPAAPLAAPGPAPLAAAAEILVEVPPEKRPVRCVCLVAVTAAQNDMTDSMFFSFFLADPSSCCNGASKCLGDQGSHDIRVNCDQY